MARLFASASSEGLDWNTFSLPTAYPFTYSAWFYPTTTSIYAAIMSVVDASSATSYFGMMQYNDNTLAFLARAAASSNAFTTNTVNANAWNHGCCVGTSATSRDVYLNGGTAGSNTTSSNPTGIDAAAIGYMTDSTPGDYYDGYIGEVAVWNAALSPAEVKSLSKGYSPLSIRPESLVSYVPLVRDEDFDRISGSGLTVLNTPQIAPSHPNVFLPRLQQIFVPSAAPAGGGRIMSSLAKDGGLAGHGGIAGQGGGLAG